MSDHVFLFRYAILYALFALVPFALILFSSRSLAEEDQPPAARSRRRLTNAWPTDGTGASCSPLQLCRTTCSRHG